MSASDVSSVPIVTNQSHPSSQIRACPDPEPSAAPSRARRASAASTSVAPASKRSRRAAKKEPKNRVPQAAARFDAHFPPHYRYSHDDHQALDIFGAWRRSIGTREFDPESREYNLLSSLLRRVLPPSPSRLGRARAPGPSALGGRRPWRLRPPQPLVCSAPQAGPPGGGLASRRVAFQGGVARAHAGSRCAAV